MNPEQRRHWIRAVLGAPDLTAAHKNVLIALSTFADYQTGSNAHPGEESLAAMCGLTTRAVRYAMDRGRALNLIARTSPANVRTGRAAVYRLVPAPITGTAVPVDSPITGTAVPVDSPITGTAVHHHRNGRSAITGTAVPPTFHRSSNDQGVVTNPGTSPAAHPTDPPPRTCKLHPDGTGGKCGPCGDARRAADAHAAASAAAQADDTTRRRHAFAAEIHACPDCDEHGWTLAEINGVNDAAVRCPAHDWARREATAHA